MCPLPDDESKDANDGENKGEVTTWLEKFQKGKPVTKEDFFGLIEARLRHIAHGKLRHERRNLTLQTSDLMNQVWIRLFHGDSLLLKLSNSTELYGLVATAIRRILIDYARMKRAERRRAGDLQRVDEIEIADDSRTSIHDSSHILTLEVALESLQVQRPHHARLVELKYYGGYSIRELSQILDMSAATVERHWELARAFLEEKMRELNSDSPGFREGP